MSQILKLGRNAAKGITGLLSTKTKKPKTEGEKKTDSAFLRVCEGSKSETSRGSTQSRYGRRPLAMPSASTSSESSASPEIPSHNFVSGNFVSGEGTTELLSGEKPAEVTPSNEKKSVHSSSESTRSNSSNGEKSSSSVNSDESESSELFFSVEETKPYRCICGSCEDSDVEKVNKVYNRDREWKWGLTKEVLGKLEHDLKKLGCLNPTPRQMELLYVYGERPDQDSDSVS